MAALLSPLGIVIGLFSLIILRALRNKYLTGLTKVPGPTWAPYTNLWRFKHNTTWKCHVDHIAMHKKYGSVLRLGPKAVSVTDWDAVRTIYGPGMQYNKSDFYPVAQFATKGRVVESLFDTTNTHYHKKGRRMITGAFSMSSVVQLEPRVDETIKDFFRQFDSRFLDQPVSVPLQTWLQYFAFDAIGLMTFSSKYGFLASGSDPLGLIKDINMALKYLSTIGCIPWLDHLFMKNPIYLGLARLGLVDSEASIISFTGKEIQRHSDAMKEKSFDASKADQDFLLQIQSAKDKDPEFMTDKNIKNFATMNIFAGSDTTGITLTAIFYYLLKNPATLEKLIEEIDAVDTTSDDGILLWKEIRSLPYLSAVFNESLRMHPATGGVLERVVPAAGLQVGPHFLPAGTIVGANAWVLHRDEEMFGGDVDKFKPERWIEASEKKQAEMKGALFAFGMGSRACLGRNISTLEIYKLVPALLRRYQFSLVDPDKEWETSNHFIVKQEGVDVYVRSRVK